MHVKIKGTNVGMAYNFVVHLEGVLWLHFFWGGTKSGWGRWYY